MTTEKETTLDRNETDILDIVRDAHQQQQEHAAIAELTAEKETAKALTKDLERQETDILEILQHAREQAVAYSTAESTLTMLKDPRQDSAAKGGATQKIADKTGAFPAPPTTSTAKAILAKEKPEKVPDPTPPGPPPTTLQRAPNTPIRQSDAGAFLSSPQGQTRPLPFDAGMLQRSERRLQPLQSPPEPVPPQEELAPLVVANEVPEGPDQPDMPLAEELDLEQEERRRKLNASDRTCSLLWGIGIFVVAAITLLLTFTLARGKEQPSVTSQPTAFPSEAPISPESHVLSLLPKEFKPTARGRQAMDWLIEDPNLWEMSEHRIRQRLALATFYLATEGTTWASNDNWMSHEIHECQWYTTNITAKRDFVTYTEPLGDFSYQSLANETSFPCNEDQVYIHLWLPQNSLRGAIPDELFLLTSLKSIVLGSNQELGGTISARLGQLKSLIWLDLAPSELIGTIPTEIGLLTNLHELFLGNTRGLQGTIPSELGLLTNIQYEFNLRENALSGTIPTELGALQKAQFFALTGNLLTGTIPTELGRLESVRWMYLHRNPLNGTLPSEFGRLTNVDRLGLYAIGLSGTIPTEVSLMSSIQLFYLYENSFTGEIPSELGLLSAAKWFYIQNNKCTGTIPTELGALTSTVAMYIDRNALTGPIPSELGLLTRLTTLDLYSNHLSGTLPTELGKMEDLKGLEVYDCSLTGTIPSEFGLLSTLEVLGLSQNELVGNLPDEFNELARNGTSISLNLTATWLSGRISEDVCGIAADSETCTEKAQWLSECSLEFDCSEVLCGCYCPCFGNSGSAAESRGQA